MVKHCLITSFKDNQAVQTFRHVSHVFKKKRRGGGNGLWQPQAAPRVVKVDIIRNARLCLQV